ncbi:TRAP transporter small permease subunit [Maritimibacter alkaliphilus]|uniref:TRAP transporter small permease subunit n=1 Tax=Maritimibacter alkaliphilus TaxID=404236 RepID=UPI001C97DA41|nr:TRAP transporter small permease [Maritimibacter alkaliphilus]MBY6092576.1 TRAP transporter small permease [Maritimibacter alkaliphilus]
MKRLLDLATLAAGAALLGLAFLTAFEVLLRKFFNQSLAGVDEIGGYVYAIGGAVGFIAAYAANAHIRINLIVARFGPLPRLILNLISHGLLLLYAGLLTWRAAAQWLRSYELEALAPTPLRTPLILPQGLWLICLAIFTLVILVKLGSTLALLVRGGDIPAAAQSLDIGDTDDETRAELASLDRRRAQDHT